MKCFIDTNVFVYAFDTGSDVRQENARRLLNTASQDINTEAVISFQVIQEYCNVMLKKGAAHDVVRRNITTALAPIAHNVVSVEFYDSTIGLVERYSLSFYDACIVQAAIDLGCTVLYSEDLQDGQQFGELKIINPFKG